MKSHGVSAAQIPFYKVLSSINSTEGREIKALGQRCLIPGLYAQHLERWVTYFPSSQVITVGNSRKWTPSGHEPTCSVTTLPSACNCRAPWKEGACDNWLWNPIFSKRKNPVTS